MNAEKEQIEGKEDIGNGKQAREAEIQRLLNEQHQSSLANRKA